MWDSLTGLFYSTAKLAATTVGNAIGNPGLEDIIEQVTPVATGIFAAKQTSDLTDNEFGNDLIKMGIGAVTLAAVCSNLDVYSGSNQTINTFKRGYIHLHDLMKFYIAQMDPVTEDAIVGTILSFSQRVITALRKPYGCFKETK